MLTAHPFQPAIVSKLEMNTVRRLNTIELCRTNSQPAWHTTHAFQPAYGGGNHVADPLVTLQDAILTYQWSRMYVLDEIKDYSRYTSLTFVDFLEALGRTADMKSLPSAQELEEAGGRSRHKVFAYIWET